MGRPIRMYVASRSRTTASGDGHDVVPRLYQQMSSQNAGELAQVADLFPFVGHGLVICDPYEVELGAQALG